MIVVRVSLVAAMRACLHEDGWSLHAHVVVDHATGRLTITPDAAWTPAQTRCLTRVASRIRGRRFTEPTFETDLTLDGRDPRPELLRTVDVAACIPNFDPGRCHLNAAVATNARRPQITAGVTWDVQGCIPTAEQLACVETRITSFVWPVNPADPASFRGTVGVAGH
jgi:hypothetical protein